MGTRSDDQWLLPLDVIRYMMSFLDRRELFALISTCSVAYSAGISPWLALQVTLRKKASKMSSFCDFIHHDLVVRSGCLRSLQLDISGDPYAGHAVRPAVFDPDIPPRIMRRLLEILSRATSLEELTIKLNQRTLDLYPDTLRIIGSLHSIRSFRPIMNLSSDALENFSRMQSLETLDLSRGYGQDVEIAKFLMPYSVHLRELSFDIAHLPYLTIPMHRVHYLSTSTHVDAMDVAQLANTFPNLIHLHVTQYMTPLAAEPIRARNLQTQPPPFRKLQVVSGGLGAIYALGLRTQIVELKTDIMGPEYAGALRPVLTDMHPRKLELRLYGCQEESQWTIHEGIFCGAPEGLDELTVVVRIDLTRMEVLLEHYLMSFLKMCAPLRVSRLNASISILSMSIFVSREGSGGFREPRKRPDKAGAFRFAKDAAEQMPTLQDITVELYSVPATRWRIGRLADDSVILDEILSPYSFPSPMGAVQPF